MPVIARQSRIANDLLVSPISALARERKTWSPKLLAGVVWRGVTHLGAHRRVMQLLKVPPLAEAARDTPRFAFKYLTHDYLARGLTTAQRADCFHHHYQRLLASVPEQQLRQALLGYLHIHEIEGYDHRFTLTISLSKDFDKEGELSLFLHVDGEVVFLMAFTIVPGSVVDSNAREVILISRVQGMKGSYQGIQLATKTLHDVAPVATLLAALEGFAAAFDIGQIVAVSAERQSSFSATTADELRQGYDEFFQHAGLNPSSDGFLKTPVPIPLKPMSQVKKGHKIRTKEKRAFKQKIQSASADFFLRLKDGSAHGPAEFLPIAELVRK